MSGLALALSLACGPSAPAPTRLPADTPIVLVSIDTLRSDRLPIYGYDAIETPAIDRLRQDSILFEHAYSPVPLTLPAHASMLTGLLPPEHEVRDNVGYRFAGDSTLYLPALLQERGYETAAFVSSFVLRGTSGLDHGFDVYDDLIASAGATSDIGGAQRSGAETASAAIDWLQRREAGPFFLFFHLYEPHTPYDPPEPFRSRYPSAYDAEVAEADLYVGRLLDELRRLEVYDRALIVLTSDHGESLGEHNYLEHGPFLYREAIQVPLLVKLPAAARAGETVSAAAQLTDILPTLQELLDLPAAPELGGASLLDLAGGEERRLYAETIYPRLHFGWSDLASIIEYPFHYIHGPDPELFDLVEDPGQTVNLVRQKRAVATALRRELDRYDRSIKPPGAEDSETREKLAALGYLTSTLVDDGADLADPKAKVHLLGKMSEALHAFRDGELDAAAAGFRGVLAEEPKMVEAWQGLGATLMAQGRAMEATEAYLEAVELTGGATHLALAAASALLQAGQLDEAREHAELAAPIHPAAHDLLAQIALRQGRLDEVEGHLAKVLSAGGRRVGPLITQAQLRLRQERFREAIELTEAAEENLGDGPRRQLRGAFLIRGDAWTRLENLAAAKDAYREEIAIAPDQLLAYSRLAFLQALDGDARAAGATLRQLVETNPRPAAHATAVETLRRMGDPRSAAAVLGQALRRWPDDPALRALAAG